MAGNSLISKISLYVQAGFYVAAGLNHFINPSFYFDLIPDYLPWYETINTVSGVVEVVFGFGLLIPFSRKMAAYGIIAMLVAFIPSHVYFIMQGNCVDSLCVAPWIGWVRLLAIHPLLIWWAWKHRN